MRARRPAALAALAAAAAIALAGCGGGGGGDTSAADTGTTPHGGTTEDELRFARASSVGSGTDGAPPPIAAAVRRAATAAGCTVRAFPSEGRDHQEGDSAYAQSNPPTSGTHHPVWADYGIYDEPVPEKYLVHALEHGAVVIHVGDGVPAAVKSQVEDLWRESPPFMIVVPEGDDPTFPKDAVVATSWQRWIACRNASARSLAAVRAFRDAYRGTGPEGSPALNAPSDAVADLGDLPRPATPDEGAVSSG